MIILPQKELLSRFYIVFPNDSMPPKEYDMYSDGQNGDGDKYGIEYRINFNTTTILFHEIGEARIGKAVKRSSAVDYENIVRKILGMEKRPYDAAHSPLGIGPTIIW